MNHFGVTGVRGEVTTGESSCGESVMWDQKAGEMVAVLHGVDLALSLCLAALYGLTTVSKAVIALANQ